MHVPVLITGTNSAELQFEGSWLFRSTVAGRLCRGTIGHLHLDSARVGEKIGGSGVIS